MNRYNTLLMHERMNGKEEDEEYGIEPECNHTNEEVDSRAQEASEKQIQDMNTDEQIKAAFARLEALLA